MSNKRLHGSINSTVMYGGHKTDKQHVSRRLSHLTALLTEILIMQSGDTQFLYLNNTEGHETQLTTRL